MNELIRIALRLTSVRIGLIACTALGFVLTRIPLLGVHGVESAVVLGAVVPLFAAAIGARVAIAARGVRSIGGTAPALRGGASSGTAPALRGGALELAGAAVAAGLSVLAAPVLVLALNALRVRNCAPLEGLAFILLGPGAGTVLAALTGACVGALVRSPKLATLLAVLVPLSDVARALYEFLATPAVFFYGHFFGYFPGALYDELVQLPPPLMTLRAITTALCVALLCLLLAHYDPIERRMRLRAQPARRAVRALMAASALFALFGFTHAAELGHRTSVGFIADNLGGRFLSQRCELLVPRELRANKRQRLAQDCDFRVDQLERWFGLRQTERVRVFVFRSADEKRRLMGAADTNIAKPWRREIYLQDDAWPHPVLPHEMAHIVAGNTGRGPLRISGQLLGLLPDFALVEGTAVAAAWEASANSGLTPHQWSRAMLELGIAPELRSLFGVNFLGQQRRLAYTFSGSLLRYIADTYGKAALRRIYATGDVERALGIPMPELEKRFTAYLRTIELPDSALALAKQRFAGSSILSSVCPHQKAELKQELEGDIMAGDAKEAERACARLLAIDPNETMVRATLVAVLARRGDLAAAQRELTKLSSPPAAAAPVIASARQALADEAFRRDQLDRAAVTYGELLAQPNDRDALRMLQVKTLALAGSPRQRALLFALLVGEPGQPTDGTTAVYLARELRNERNDGLPQYLEARQLMMRERFEEAAGLLATARELGLPTREITMEALRVEALCRYGTADLDRSAKLWQQFAAMPGVPPALRAEADDWLERIAFAQRKRS